jgi:hypothetical protein
MTIARRVGSACLLSVTRGARNISRTNEEVQMSDEIQIRFKRYRAAINALLLHADTPTQGRAALEVERSRAFFLLNATPDECELPVVFPTIAYPDALEEFAHAATDLLEQLYDEGQVYGDRDIENVLCCYCEALNLYETERDENVSTLGYRLLCKAFADRMRSERAALSAKS